MAEAQHFFARWSQRKTEVARGVATAEPVPEPESAPTPTPSTSVQEVSPSPGASETVDAPALTLDDVQALRPESDFSPFTRQHVAADVRNAAMKKLFADPRYNVMDGLDIYIDDYSLPDPIPEAMLRQMVGAQFLKLFDDEPTTPISPGAPRSPNSHPLPHPESPHAHADLRLQPDPAAGRPSHPGDAGPGPESAPTPDAQTAQRPVPP